MKKIVLITLIVIGMIAVSGFYNMGDADEIYGCYKKNNGQLRIVDSLSKCDLSENPVKWEEIALKLFDVIVGTWNIQNYNYENNIHSETGKVVFNADGSFDLIEGSFAAIGMGSATVPGPAFCGHTEDNQTYQFFTDNVVLFTHYNPLNPGGYNNPPFKNAVIPQTVEVQENEIVFVGSGGCGNIALQRISVLNRVSE